MSEEAVLIDKEGKEVDWIDPVDKTWEDENRWYVEHASGTIYEFEKKEGYKMVVRNLKTND